MWAATPGNIPHLPECSPKWSGSHSGSKWGGFLLPSFSPFFLWLSSSLLPFFSSFLSLFLPSFPWYWSSTLYNATKVWRYDRTEDNTKPWQMLAAQHTGRTSKYSFSSADHYSCWCCLWLWRFRDSVWMNQKCSLLPLPIRPKSWWATSPNCGDGDHSNDSNIFRGYL